MTDIDVSSLEGIRAAWRRGLSPFDVVEEVVRRIASSRGLNAWITMTRPDELRARAAALDRIEPRGPLWGVPFAVKDNIDVAGYPTTAGCPAYAYVPTDTAPVVRRLLDAGALLVGKTNMDQFATGLAGTRSPYGIGRSVLDPRLISGGSSSGSAIAVASSMVTFAVGTDTAGSGRVPAACNGLVGFKPSLGLLSTRGIVPACRSLDCVSVFSRRVDDAWSVIDASAGYDALDPFSRAVEVRDGFDEPVRLGVPASLLVENQPLADAFVAVAERVTESLAAKVVAFDLTPFRDAGAILYGGAWLAERYASVGKFLDAHPEDVDPTVAAVVGGGRTISGVEVFDDLRRRAELLRRTAAVWETCDVLLLPTVDYVPTVDEVLADPITANSRLGTFTTCVNLLGLAAVAVPAGTTPDGRPFGVTLIGPDGADRLLAGLASRVGDGRIGRITSQPA